MGPVTACPDHPQCPAIPRNARFLLLLLKLPASGRHYPQLKLPASGRHYRSGVAGQRPALPQVQGAVLSIPHFTQRSISPCANGPSFALTSRPCASNSTL